MNTIKVCSDCGSPNTSEDLSSGKIICLNCGHEGKPKLQASEKVFKLDYSSAPTNNFTALNEQKNNINLVFGTVNENRSLKS